jgi:hypothetical protein
MVGSDDVERTDMISAPVDLVFLATQAERLQQEVAELRAAMAEFSAGLTALTQHTFDLQREIAWIKDTLSRIEEERTRKP